MNAADAEEFTQTLEQLVTVSWRQIALAVRLGVPEAMGLSTPEWSHLIGNNIRLPVVERREAVLEITAPDEDGHPGLSHLDAAAVLNVDRKTVDRDLGGTNVLTELDDEEKPSASGTNVPRPHVANNGHGVEEDWYTPAPYIEAARAVMGAIDLDPASSAEANEIVGAACYYTAKDDGLRQDWSGRVWMNPPYAQPAIDRFCTRLAREYTAGVVTEACALVNNATETAWFQALLVPAGAVCFPRGRVRYWHRERDSSYPLQGQAVLYLGRRGDVFADAFRRFGIVR